MLELGKSQCEIAMCIGVSQATISKEVKRNSLPYGKHLKLRKYIALHAQRCAAGRKERFMQPRKFTPEMVGFVRDKLTKEQWSPCQIVGYARKEGLPMVSVERIYQYIRKDKYAGGNLYKHCRHKLKRRKHDVCSKVGLIPDRVSIHNRPCAVDFRERFGDWEMDLIQGRNNTFILTMIERKTRYLEMMRLPNGRRSAGVAKAVKDMLLPYRNKVLTITTDNGSEFSKHKDIAKSLNAKVYFTDPYSSWQKGTIENTNKLIRQYIPKRINFNTLSDKYIQQIENKINNRPRKTLEFNKPAEEFFKHFYNFRG
jgi:IS30 family transposase